MDALALCFAAVGAVVCGIIVAHRTGRYLNFGSLLIVNLALVGPVSGIVHVLRIGDASRGYFDLNAVAFGGYRNAALWACLIAVIATCAGCLHGSARVVRHEQQLGDGTPHRYWEPDRWLVGAERRLLACAGLVLLVLGAYAAAKVNAFALEQGRSRIIAVSEGIARYAFMSNWLVWVISFTLIAFASVRALRNPTLLFLALCAGIVLIAISLSWAGGRSIVLVMALPIVLTLLPLLRGVRFLAVAGGVVALVAYTAAVTRARATSQAIETTSWASALDWQWGRYSMTGFAADRVGTHGYMWGETFFAGINNLVTGLLALLGLSGIGTDAQTVTGVAASYFYLPKDQGYIVPGLVSELYLNLGLVGIAVGCYVLARVTVLVDQRFVTAGSPIIALAWAYIGTLLVFRTWNSDSGTIWAFIAFNGAPLIAAAVASSAIRKRHVDPEVAPPPSTRTRRAPRPRRQLAGRPAPDRRVGWDRLVGR